MSAEERRYRRGLAEGTQVAGAFCCLDGFATSHMLAAAGFDFLIFDRQHAAYTWPELEQLCFRVRSEGCSPFIRVASTEEAELNLALDLPVDGIVLPNLISAEDTRRALSFCKFPPDGVRSLGNERHSLALRWRSQPPGRSRRCELSGGSLRGRVGPRSCSIVPYPLRTSVAAYRHGGNTRSLSQVRFQSTAFEAPDAP